MGAINDKLEALQAEIERLKASAPTVVDHAAERAWRDQQHQNSERRAAAYNPFSRADLQAMREAAPDSVCQAIVADNRGGTGPRSQAAMPANATPGPMTPPGAGSGWMRETPLRPPPGVAQADRLMAHEDLEFRRQRIVEEARLQSLMKAPTEEKLK